MRTMTRVIAGSARAGGGRARKGRRAPKARSGAVSPEPDRGGDETVGRDPHKEE
jgi:hypothetical protein